MTNEIACNIHTFSVYIHPYVHHVRGQTATSPGWHLIPHLVATDRSTSSEKMTATSVAFLSMSHTLSAPTLFKSRYPMTLTAYYDMTLSAHGQLKKKWQAADSECNIDKKTADGVDPMVYLAIAITLTQ